MTRPTHTVQIPVQIRLARPSDAPALEAMQQRSARELSTLHYSRAMVEAYLSQCGTLDVQLIRDQHYFVATHDGTVVGSGGWSDRRRSYGGGESDAGERRDPAREPAVIRGMFVEPALARRGIGERILAVAEDAARRAGFGSVELWATPLGARLYERTGYTVERRLELQLAGGHALAMLHMSKALACESRPAPHPRAPLAASWRADPTARRTRRA